MTWSYSGDPASSLVDATHFLLSDTNSADQVAQNEEYAWALSQQGNNPYLAAAIVAEAKAQGYARLARRVKMGDSAIDYGERAKDFLVLAMTLRTQAAVMLGRPYAGGISVGDKALQDSDTDRVKPFATVRKGDFPGSGFPSFDEHDAPF